MSPAGAEGIWLLPLLLFFSLGTAWDISGLLSNSGRPIHRRATLLATAIITLSACLPMMWALFGSEYPPNCPVGKLGWIVIAAVASLFASERKHEKGRKWFERAVILDPELGDSWARYYAFESESGSTAQKEKVKERCVAAEPKHGELWCSFMKQMENRQKSIGEGLELVAKKIQEQKELATVG